VGKTRTLRRVKYWSQTTRITEKPRLKGLLHPQSLLSAIKRRPRIANARKARNVIQERELKSGLIFIRVVDLHPLKDQPGIVMTPHILTLILNKSVLIHVIIDVRDMMLRMIGEGDTIGK
jgi:hypothetical protein